MKTNLIFFFAFFLASNFVSAQDQECLEKTSIFHEYVKAKNYDGAYEPWKAVYEKCPKYSLVIYLDGEKILKYKMDQSAGSEKATYINALAKLYEDRLINFSNKSKAGVVLTDKARLFYDYRDVLNKSDLELYNMFDKAYETDQQNFQDPTGILIYFKLMVQLYDAKIKKAEDLFEKYDDISEHLQQKIGETSENLNELAAKEEAGQSLTNREQQYKKYYEQLLTAYDQIVGSIDAEIGQRANCENLIPLYERLFEAKKMDEQWLRRAAGRIRDKGCDDNPLFLKLVNALHNVNPSSDSAFYLGILQDKQGNSNKALKFYEQALSLETDNIKKARLADRIGNIFKEKGAFSSARNYFRQAVNLNPSNGRPYLKIANMYAQSANNCGTSNFNKRAVFWLAAAEARKAARVDPTLTKAAAQTAASYDAKAPQKSDIFGLGNAGKTIQIGCWIGASVTVPSL